jgi:hypothetical protein
MLEAAVKYVYVDQQLPADTPLEDRIRYLGDRAKVPRSSVRPVDHITFQMVDAEQFRSAVHQSFAALSGYVHPSRKALEERLSRAARGEFSGFEGARVLEAFNRLASQTLDLVLALNFEGAGRTVAGDLFIQVFNGVPRWKFHRTKFSAQVSHLFDYKAERRADT